MPTISTSPIKYTVPYPGQVFRREEQDGRWDLGVINGVKVTYAERDGEKTAVGWTASLTTGFRDFRDLIKFGASYQNTTDWHPAPVDMQVPEAVRALFESLMAKVEGRCDALEARITEHEAWAEHTQTPSITAFQEELKVLKERVNENTWLHTQASEAFVQVNARIDAIPVVVATPGEVVQSTLPTGTSTTVSAPVNGTPPERPRRGAPA